jgi:hypothetical protein
MFKFKTGDKVNYLISDNKNDVYTVYMTAGHSHVYLCQLDNPDVRDDRPVNVANIQHINNAGY